MIKKLLILIIPLLIILAGTANAATCEDHDTWGYAWSDSIGWISFSCRNNNLVGSGINYGVDINADTGELSGYAWSENIGWISFDDATVNLGTGTLSGWARALAPIGQPLEKTGGWDGWISLSDTTYQVQIDSSFIPSRFKNWAWGGDVVVGWISFNCSNTGTCGTSNYKVYTNVNSSPSVTINPITKGDYCTFANPPIWLNWTFSDPEGFPQSAYQIQIDNNSDFSSIEIDTGKIVSASDTYAPPGLAYNTAYYWRIRVWDSGDLSSGWVVPLPASFATGPRWPKPSFTYSPLAPIINNGVAFDGEVDYCSSCSYAWDFDDGSSGSIVKDPVHTFFIEDDYTVVFTATDDGVRSCSVSNVVPLGGNLPLPVWQEITPF